MNTKPKAVELSKEVLKKLLECGTEIDEFYRLFRELRLLEDESPNFAKAILNVEHGFFMTIQSLNILKEQLQLLSIAAKKEEIT
ncbi:MAG: hypothetical protein ACP5LI_06985 [Hydrogenobaculum sp.]|nr:MAG: hypothetical protein C0170_02525 [Hydrogenobaculum sp.]